MSSLNQLDRRSERGCCRAKKHSKQLRRVVICPALVEYLNRAPAGALVLYLRCSGRSPARTIARVARGQGSESQVTAALFRQASGAVGMYQQILYPC